MPVEAGPPPFVADDRTVGAGYLTEARNTLAQSLAKIENCLNQLPEADLSWRPHESHNSIQNILLHLCGNLRQWIVCGVPGTVDHRDRPAEFADRNPRGKAELTALIRSTVQESTDALAACPPERLLEPRTIQGFRTTILSAVFDSVSHFVGHTHQIVYITRLRLGDAYRFQWTPPA